MGESLARFSTQTNALFRKNLTFQRRNFKSHACLAAFPIVLCLLLFSFEIFLKKYERHLSCDCVCAQKSSDGSCDTMKCANNENSYQDSRCPVPKAKPWPPVLQIPFVEYRAVRTESIPFDDLPDESCRSKGTCPVTMLYTGGDKSFVQSLMNNSYISNSSDPFNSWENLYLASEGESSEDFSPDSPLYTLKSECPENFTVYDPMTKLNISCLPSLHLWRESSSVMRNETLMGYFNLNPERKTNEIVAAYDFLNSSEKSFSVSIWYNVTDDDRPLSGFSPSLLNAVSNSYIQLLRDGVRMPFDFVKAMPTWPDMNLDFLSIFRPLLFSWIILQLFPVILSYLVYEKKQKLRIMMKMHGLGDGPYWIISYVYFCFLSSIYTLCLVVSGSLIGLDFFTQTSYSVQFVFYFSYINLQIAHAFLASSFFSNVKTATVVGHLYALGSGLLGLVVFETFFEKPSFPSVGRILLEILPCLSLYRGLYELEQYSSTIYGIRWKDLRKSGMRELLIIMLLEWLVFLLVAYYCDQVASVGSGVRKHPLYFLKNFHRRSSLYFHQPSRRGSGVSVEMEKLDVTLERKKVEQLLLEPSTGYAVICDNLKKMYPTKDGGQDKFAVRCLSLALPQGECFGMLGPNGAGKTSSINMMIGLMTPTSGTVYIHGLDIKIDMDKIYSSMGVCPQDNLLWETLTAREHLLFYGRLKNLNGGDLAQAVEESLKSVNLFYGGAGDKQAGKYSGGMKRRLSVAISLIGNPKVVYMDEPSSGLDPASRRILWDAVKKAKRTCAIILTTHSMEEAEVLCDRLGIVVDGSLQCIGNPTELKARYGETRVFTVTTSQNQEQEAENLARQLSPSAEKVYHLSGTQKFELRKDEVSIAKVFKAVEDAKKSFPVYSWGLTDTTLEDVFIKVAKEAQTSNEL